MLHNCFLFVKKQNEANIIREAILDLNAAAPQLLHEEDNSAGNAFD